MKARFVHSVALSEEQETKLSKIRTETKYSISMLLMLGIEKAKRALKIKKRLTE